MDLSRMGQRRNKLASSGTDVRSVRIGLERGTFQDSNHGRSLSGVADGRRPGTGTASDKVVRSEPLARRAVNFCYGF